MHHPASRRNTDADGREKRRRAGIPDSDTRPWLIARPAAELRRREEAARKAAEEAAEAERKRLTEKQAEIDEWGQQTLKTLKKLHEGGMLRRRVDRKVEDDE